MILFTSLLNKTLRFFEHLYCLAEVEGTVDNHLCLQVLFSYLHNQNPGKSHLKSKQNQFLWCSCRNTKEIGFVLILNGIYQGFGYVDKKIKLEDTNDYQLYLQPQQDNRDVQRILRSYLTKK